MNDPNFDRRDFLKSAGLGAVAAGIGPGMGMPTGRADPAPLVVDPTPRFELSPWLYMQFMEPLGTTDSSVDAAWNYLHDHWRPDVVDATRELAPTLIRWGGCFISYYRWREGVGRRDQREPNLNLLWGGVNSNQVGTHEFVDFCRQVDAEPFFCVNFESDGRKQWAVDPKGSVRSAGPEEAADWVAYCNDPDHAERIANGAREPFDLKLWQIGNETSYDPNGFDRETAARKTAAFARAMRAVDPDLDLVGWGEGDWAESMLEIAGEHLQYLAFHNGFGAGGPDSPLSGIDYREDADATWDACLRMVDAPAARIREMRDRVAGHDIKLAITECHAFIPGRNRGDVLSTWAAGVANAKLLHTHERNGDVVHIATQADFCGNRWQNNALMVPTPAGRPFLMPVAMVMALYRRHTGERYLEVESTPDGLDVTASRTGDRVFLHVANTLRTRSIDVRLGVTGRKVRAGRAHWIALDPEYEVFEHRPDVTAPKQHELDTGATWTVPAASVTAIELDLEPA